MPALHSSVSEHASPVVYQPGILATTATTTTAHRETTLLLDSSPPHPTDSEALSKNLHHFGQRAADDNHEDAHSDESHRGSHHHHHHHQDILHPEHIDPFVEHSALDHSREEFSVTTTHHHTPKRNKALPNPSAQHSTLPPLHHVSATSQQVPSSSSPRLLIPNPPTFDIGMVDQEHTSQQSDSQLLHARGILSTATTTTTTTTTTTSITSHAPNRKRKRATRAHIQHLEPRTVANSLNDSIALDTTTQEDVPPGSDCFYVQALRLNPYALFFIIDLPMAPFTFTFLLLIQTQTHLLLFLLLLLQCVCSALGVLFLLPLSILIMTHSKFKRLQYFWTFPAAMVLVGKFVIFAIMQGFWFDWKYGRGDIKGLLVLIGFDVYGIANLMCCLVICARCVFVTSRKIVEFQHTASESDDDDSSHHETKFAIRGDSRQHTPGPTSSNHTQPKTHAINGTGRSSRRKPHADCGEHVRTTAHRDHILDEISLPTTSILGTKSTEAPESFMMDSNLYEDIEDNFHE